jgi:hypothetical protein
MKKEPKSLAEWLEQQGNPKHAIAEGTDGSMVIAVDDYKSLTPSVTLYNFKETEFPGGYKHFWISSGWGVWKDYLPAIHELFEKLTAGHNTPEHFMEYNITSEETGDVVTTIEAVTDHHAITILNDGKKTGAYPEDCYLERTGVVK